MKVLCLICILILLLIRTSINSSNGFFILFQSNPLPEKGLFSYPNLKSMNSQLDCTLPASLMAFSQVEIASSSPFDYVLRDQNRREKWGRESNGRAAFQKNLKDLVQSCISAPTRNSDSDFNKNSCNADSKVQIPQNKTNTKNHKGPENNDKRANAQEIVFERETSPAQSDCSVEVPNIRVVSSIVQRWRDFEAESKNLNMNSTNNNNSTLNSPVCSSRSNSNSTFTENTSIPEIPTRNSVASESVEEMFETPTMAEDLSTDWESDRTATSGPPSTWSRDSNATENERIRVVDIIRRLTSVNGEEYGDREQFLTNESLPKIRTSLENPPEMRGFAAASASPKIRGRQAFKDLLMQMERERDKEIEGLRELRAVSKFSQRGRIQALLRLRFLRHGVEGKNGSKFNSTVPERNKHSQGSSIMHLRERFNTGSEHNAANPRSHRREVINNTEDVEKCSASNQLKEVVDQTPNAINPSSSNQLKKENHSREVTHPKSPRKNITINTSDSETCFTSDRLKVDINHQDVMTPQPSTSRLHNQENTQKEACPSLDVTLQCTSYEVRNLESQESADTITSLNVSKGRNEEENKAQKVQSSASLNDWIKDISPLHGDWENQEANEGLETGTNWTSDFSQAPGEWEEEELSYQQMEESYQDWINDVSRPRSDWEGLRQERYQEMLDPFTDNGDIKQLLERRSVSTFLSSALRERIDQLMISRTQGQQNVVNNQVEEHMEEEEKEGNDQNEQEEASAEQYEEAEEENKSQITRQYSEVGEYFDQTPSSINSATPSIFKSWSRNQDHDVSDDSFSTPSMQQSFSSSSYTRDDQQCSSFKNRHPSIEMELIYGLRGQMEQLHQEIFDLRKALKSCVKMQVKMQHSMKQKAANSPSHLARKKCNASMNRTQRKGTCCLCCESEVDSLLYGCGHMCTCYKCAQELQWGSGKCPICRAPILDVVRTYLDYRF